MASEFWQSVTRTFFFGSVLLAACEGTSLKVGASDAGGSGPATLPDGWGGFGPVTGGGGGSGPFTTLPEWPAPSDCVPSSDLELVGTWEGAIRDFEVRTIVPLRLQILGASEPGGVCGTLRWGDGPPPPPPRHPDANWPEDASFDPDSRDGDYFYDGATYTLTEGVVIGSSLRFVITTSELWKDWCALQTPYPYPYPNPPNYHCVPPANDYEYSPDAGTCRILLDDEPAREVGIAKCSLCGPSRVCICSRDACTAAPDYTDLAFELTFDGEQLTGKLVGKPANFTQTTDLPPYDVLLTRVEERKPE